MFIELDNSKLHLYLAIIMAKGANMKVHMHTLEVRSCMLLASCFLSFCFLKLKFRIQHPGMWYGYSQVRVSACRGRVSWLVPISASPLDMRMRLYCAVRCAIIDYNQNQAAEEAKEGADADADEETPDGG
jgi:hypothetical protein